MKKTMRILVTGAGGFIGHHLVKRLRGDGHWVRGVDIKSPEYEKSEANDFQLLDLREYQNCLASVAGSIDEVYNLAADMGGIGYITVFHADIARNNILINAHMLEAARQKNVSRFLFSSSACVYAQSKQKAADVTPLREKDAYPAEPEPGYGWEKLYAEELCNYFRQDHRLDTRIVRFHNVYGPLGTYEGCREILRQETRCLQAPGSAGPKQRQQPRAQNPRLGAVLTPGKGAGHYLSLDRKRTRQSWPYCQKSRSRGLARPARLHLRKPTFSDGGTKWPDGCGVCKFRILRRGPPRDGGPSSGILRKRPRND